MQRMATGADHSVWYCTTLTWMCYTEKASPTRHRPEHQHNAPGCVWYCRAGVPVSSAAASPARDALLTSVEGTSGDHRSFSLLRGTQVVGRK